MQKKYYVYFKFTWTYESKPDVSQSGTCEVTATSKKDASEWVRNYYYENSEYELLPLGTMDKIDQDYLGVNLDITDVAQIK